MLKEVTCDSDIIIITLIKPIKGAIQVQTQLAWALAFTGLLAILINAEQLPRWAPAARPGENKAKFGPPACHATPPAPQKTDCAPAQISSGHL